MHVYIFMHVHVHVHNIFMHVHVYVHNIKPLNRGMYWSIHHYLRHLSPAFENIYDNQAKIVPNDTCISCLLLCVLFLTYMYMHTNIAT